MMTATPHRTERPLLRTAVRATKWWPRRKLRQKCSGRLAWKKSSQRCNKNNGRPFGGPTEMQRNAKKEKAHDKSDLAALLDDGLRQLGYGRRRRHRGQGCV